MSVCLCIELSGVSCYITYYITYSKSVKSIKVQLVLTIMRIRYNHSDIEIIFMFYRLSLNMSMEKILQLLMLNVQKKPIEMKLEPTAIIFFL